MTNSTRFASLVSRWCPLVAIALALYSIPGSAQFSAGIQGVVSDPTGAVIPKATVTLVNTATKGESLTTSGQAGDYRFVSLSPGSYLLSASAPGFAMHKVEINVQTNETLSVPVQLTVSSQSENVVVTTQAPVLNTAESRIELTLTNQSVDTLPLSGRNLINLVTMAPGVTGKGTVAGGSPGSAIDNFSTELQVDASANGRGSVGNMFIVDGLDITSFIRPGVLNLTPSPDSVQETSIQTNTYTVEYGRASGIQMAMTTKSGSDAYHGLVGDFYTSQQLWTHTHFLKGAFKPYHTSNMMANIGGPIIPHHQFFGFFSIEPYRQLSSSGSTTIIEDPQFTAWAKQNYPNTIGTKLLTTYLPSNATSTGVNATALDVFPTTCGTAAVGNMPCNLPLFDSATYSSSNYVHAYQYNFRIDKDFNKDRIYGTFFKIKKSNGGPNPRPAFVTTSDYHNVSVQLNETHTFSPNMLNEAIFGYLSIEGISPSTGNFKVPSIGVSKLGAGFGDGFALGDFIQHSYHWRDVLHGIKGKHSIDIGYEGWFGQDIVYFQGPYSLPSFSYNNIYDLVTDSPFKESGIAVDPLSGKASGGNYFFAEFTGAGFIQDRWKIGSRVTLNYGIRYDNFGNPKPIMNQIMSTFHYGAGSTLLQTVANGYYRQTTKEFNHALAAWSPRAGVAWDMTGNSTWVFHGGFGLYHDWLTLGNAENSLKGNPPGWISPTFFRGTATPPVLSFGTSNSYPFGFTYPSLPPGQLDSHGGIVGLQPAVGGYDENLKAPNSYVFTATIERSLGKNFVGSAGYMGQYSTDLILGSSQTDQTSYGIDINRYDGDLIQHNSLVPTRLNPSFGAMSIGGNTSKSQYNAFYVAVQGRISRSYFNTSYTRGWAYNDSGIDTHQGGVPYPTATNIHQYWGPASSEVPHRLSASWSYNFPEVRNGSELVKGIANQWSLSGTVILQSGNPFTVFNGAPFNPQKDSSGKFIGYIAGSGDFNADGVNYDFPNVTSYTMPHGRTDYLNGALSKSNFPNPTFGSEGSEKVNQFYGPGFAEYNMSLLKNIPIREGLKAQLRMDAFNAFNRVNLSQTTNDMNSGSFGKSTSQLEPRWLQFGARVQF